jgi:hypothetical protein
LNLRSYAGVCDFDAPDGVIMLPRSVAEALCVVGSGSVLAVRVAAKDVPPFAEGITLEPQSGDFFDDISDPAAWLTRVLPDSFVVITEGALLRLPAPASCGGAPYYDVLVRSLTPATHKAVRITDTNVALDLLPPADASDVSAPRGRVRALARTGEPASIALAPGASWRLRVAAAGGALRLRLSAGPGVCAFAARAPNARPRLEDHEWALLSSGERLLTAAEATAWPGELASRRGGAAARAGDGSVSDDIFIQVFNDGAAESRVDVSSALVIAEGVEEPAAASAAASSVPRALGVEFPAAAGAPPTSDAPVSMATDDDATRACGLCGARLPAASLPLHELQCAKHRVKCSQCGLVLRRDVAARHAHCEHAGCGIVLSPDDREAHARALHWDAPRACRGCAATPESLLEAARHARRFCASRLITCRFCENAVAAGGPPRDAVDAHRGLDAHEADCGARTRVCGECSPRVAVRLKEWEDHRALFHRQSGAGSVDEVDGSAASAAAAAAAAAAPARRRSDSLGRASDDEVMALRGSGATTPVADDAHTRSMAAGATAAGGGGGGGGIAVRSPLCSNALCANRNHNSASDGALGLCRRCHDILLDGAGFDEAAGEAGARGAALERLARAYATQLRVGCGAAGCRNLGACRTSSGADALRDAGAIDNRVAALTDCAKREPQAGIWLCVPDARRITVTPATFAAGAVAPELPYSGTAASGNRGRPPAAAARARISRAMF